MLLWQTKTTSRGTYQTQKSPSSYKLDWEDLDNNSYRSKNSGNLIDTVISKSWTKIGFDYKCLSEAEIQVLLPLLANNPIYVKAKNPIFGNEYVLFTDTFKLGSVASNTFKLSVLKTAVNSQPTNVRIEDDNTTWNFIVDNIVEDDNFYAYTLTDKLVDFNFDYDASVLINSKAELGEDCYLSDIWKDMCLKANVDYDDNYIFENDIVVNWYDSRVQARRYLSYIAELQSGYACILENGKQSFKKQNRSSVKTIDADECSDLIVGEKKTITRVIYDGGAFKWEFGDETGETLYIQKDNVFIVNEGRVENIYKNIKDCEFYRIDAPNAPMDSTIKAGDIITISDNGVMYPTDRKST